ncbi:hypothetical protein G9F73_010395 [Clostridium estertheticum]|uniref:hypothetical protein n=1 Tax=Clostridium estertheticum TaxID=238834 RepID=UPI0013EE5477|nr:hypothetical protein [Clostridium estertheticum]MBZ9608214.1 hypothetical protein [Clostridium estertheticum]
MNERDKKINTIERFKELKRKVDKYDRYNYYINVKGRKTPALIVMELKHTGNGYINGHYANAEPYEMTKAGDIKMKNLTDDEITKLIEEAMQNIKNQFSI